MLFQGEIVPVFLAIVDVTGDAKFIETVKKSLLACVEVLPDKARFGLVTFSDRLGIFDMTSSSLPLVHYVRLPADGSGV
jgi:hypothetical protein